MEDGRAHTRETKLGCVFTRTTVDDQGRPVRDEASTTRTGAINEAGCKTVMGSRLERSGMFGTVRGANAVMALRCCRHSRQFDDHWESRRK